MRRNGGAGEHRFHLVLCLEGGHRVDHASDLALHHLRRGVRLQTETRDEIAQNFGGEDFADRTGLALHGW
jgi:hypothetical protein